MRSASRADEAGPIGRVPPVALAVHIGTRVGREDGDAIGRRRDIEVVVVDVDRSGRRVVLQDDHNSVRSSGDEIADRVSSDDSVGCCELR